MSEKIGNIDNEAARSIPPSPYLNRDAPARETIPCARGGIHLSVPGLLSIYALTGAEETMMERWKLVKFCETATLEQLREKEVELRTALDNGRLSGTNAAMLLKDIQEYIELRETLGFMD